MAGRRPKPTALKELTGNPGGRPLNKLEPKPPLGIPEMPKGMGKCGQREFISICAALHEMKILSVVDGKALGEYCKLMEMAEIYYKQVIKKPMYFEPILDGLGSPIYDKQGNLVTKPKPNPAANTYALFSKAAKGYLVEFGLTPSSRSRLKIDKAAADDPNDSKFTRERPAESGAPKEDDKIDLDSIDETALVM